MHQHDSCIYPVVMDIVSCHLNNGVSKSDATTISAVEVPLLLCKWAVQLSMVWYSYQLHRCTCVIWVIICATELQIDINKWEVVLLEDEKITIGLSVSVINAMWSVHSKHRLDWVNAEHFTLVSPGCTCIWLMSNVSLHVHTFDDLKACRIDVTWFIEADVHIHWRVPI